MVERVKKAIAPFYTDYCNVYEKKVTEGEHTHFEEVLIYEKIPCRVSAKSYLFGENAGSERKNLLEISKKVKLFVPPEYKINAGSKIEVFHKGGRQIFGKSGEMNFYLSHNEVMVDIVKNYA